MNMQITASQQKFNDAHKARMEKFWPEQKQSKPDAPTKEQFAAAWQILDGPNVRHTIRSIQDLVCTHFSVPRLYMETARRAHHYYLPRAAAIYLCKQFTSKSYPEIGRRFGNRDHSTIMSCVASVEKMIALNHPISKDIEILSAKLGGFQ